MSDLLIQGNATELEKPFAHGDEIMILRSGCFDKSLRSRDDIKLLMNHDFERCLGSWPDSLLLYAGKKGLAFRYILPSSKGFEEIADDVLTYVPISIGFDRTKSETTQVDGVTVVTVIEAKLNEISILDKAPAVHSTYGRVVSWDTCGSLQDDFETGRLDLVGRFIGLHRAVKAMENGGKIEYRHITTPYERAADRFSTALRNLSYPRLRMLGPRDTRPRGHRQIWPDLRRQIFEPAQKARSFDCGSCNSRIRPARSRNGIRC